MMKIDKDWFDSKGRYWVFYISIGWDHFMFALCIAGHEIGCNYMKYTPLTEDLE